MKVEVTTEGFGKGTIATLDGDRLTHVRSVNLEISADGIAVLTIDRFATNENNQFILEPDGSKHRHLKTETLQIRGSVTFEGEAIALARSGC